MPLLVIRVYRLIPERIRVLWSFGSSSSHLALANPSWRSIWLYAISPAWRAISVQEKPGWSDVR